MGGRGYVSKKINRLTGEQANRIGVNRLGGEWYAKVDPDTGAIQWLRKKVKKKRK